MKVGISTATFFSKVLTEDSFSVIQRCGGDTCEVFLTTFYEYKDSFGRLLKERKGDFDVYSVHSLNTQFEPQLFNKVQRTYDDAEGVFRSVLNVGQIIGAKAYTFHAQARLKQSVYIDPQFAGERMSKRSEISRESGIEL